MWGVRGEGERAKARRTEAEVRAPTPTRPLTSRDEEVHHDALHFGLAALEVVAADHDGVLLRELHHPRHEGVLRGAVDVGGLLQDARHSEERGRGDLLLTAGDGLEQVLRRVVDALLNGREPLRVGRPQHHHFVQAVSRFEVADILANLIHLLLLAPRQAVVGAVGLVGGDEVGEVDGGHGRVGRHLVVELVLEVHVQHRRPPHGLAEVHGADVPAADDQVVGVDHRHEVLHRNVHGGTRGLGTDLHRGGLRHRPEVVARLLALLRAPRQLLPVR